MVRVYLALSLDGYVAGPGDDLSFLDGFDTTPGPGALPFDAFMQEVGAMLMGRRTFDVVSGFGGPWPYGSTPVLVATHRPLGDAPASVTATRGPIADLVAQAQELAGDRDVYLDGAALSRAALEADLVDELTLTLVPRLLGGGTSLFAGCTARSDWAFAAPAVLGELTQVRAARVR